MIKGGGKTREKSYKDRKNHKISERKKKLNILIKKNANQKQKKIQAKI